MKRLLGTVLVLLLVTASGCGSDPREKVVVLAASSLTESFTALRAEFAKTPPDVDVGLVFDSSQALGNMAVQGAPGDVLATADGKTMSDTTLGHGTDGTPVKFASNVMVVVVPPDNPAHIKSFADLKKSQFVTCVLKAPCGTLANQLMVNHKLKARPVSEEVDVKAVLARVVGGEADAGIVYATDAKAAGDKVRSIAIPGAQKTPNAYWIARTAQFKTPQANTWIHFVLGPEGQQILADYGFGKP